MKKIVLLFTIIIALSTLINAQTTEIKPTGIFQEIDVARHNAAIEILNNEDKKSKQQMVETIIKNPNYYAPPVIYVLSRVLFSKGKKDDATYWFYIAQLRARYDANLCMDNSAKQAVSVLNAEYGPDINKYAFQHVQKLEKTVMKVIDFVRTNEENYDHRWINLHGMDAVLSGIPDSSNKPELSQPKEQWPEIKNKTINDYYQGFIEYVKPKKN